MCLQYISGIEYLEFMQTLQIKGSVLPKLHQLQATGFPGNLTSDQLATNSGVTTIPLGLLFC